MVEGESMYEYEFRSAKTPERELIFWNPSRMSETIVHLNEWSGCEGSIQSISIDGSVATISYIDGINNVHTERYELDTNSNIAEKL